MKQARSPMWGPGLLASDGAPWRAPQGVWRGRGPKRGAACRRCKALRRLGLGSRHPVLEACAGAHDEQLFELGFEQVAAEVLRPVDRAGGA